MRLLKRSTNMSVVDDAEAVAESGNHSEEDESARVSIVIDESKLANFDSAHDEIKSIIKSTDQSICTSSF